ncbi:hypothetical protein [Kineococcus arenarius]|uniref:hypothetical protein n=1 Tax=Kineococcus sp. SYSU DK007 TaxID=3383128 RepID=UPI003D7DA57A
MSQISIPAHAVRPFADLLVDEKVLVAALEQAGYTVSRRDKPARYWSADDVAEFLRTPKPAYVKFAAMALVLAQNPNQRVSFTEAAEHCSWSAAELSSSVKHLGRWLKEKDLPRPYYESWRLAKDGVEQQSEKIYWFDQVQARQWLEGVAAA